MKRLILLTTLLMLVASTSFAAPIVLRATNTLGEDHPMTMALRYMSTEIAKRTNGEVKLDVYPNSQLGGNKEMVEGAMLGTIDIAPAVCRCFLFLCSGNGHPGSALPVQVRRRVVQGIGW